MQTAPRTAVALGWPAAPGLPALVAGDAVHLVGIGGAGMRGLATVMAARGLRVSGSDRAAGEALTALAASGVTVHVGHDGDHIGADCRMVIASPAVPQDNPELVAARRLGVPVSKRAVLLGALLDRGRGIAVAGTHGKTTTTAWLAIALLEAGLDPTVFVGGDVAALGGHARVGAAGDAMDGGEGEGLVLIEADEYDRSFLHGHAEVAVITNLEHDHPDIYPNPADVEAAFSEFASRVKPEGRLILWAGTPAAAALTDACPATVETYAVEGDPIAAGAPVPRWLARSVAATPTHTRFDLVLDGTCLGTYQTRMHGRHNVANALAVIAAAAALGLEPAAVREGLTAHRGVGRRMDVLGEIAGVLLVDDYAHHPTEIAATLDAARSRWPQRRLWAILQPHTYSRVAAMTDRFAAALAPADVQVLAPIFGARESAADFPGVNSEGIARHLPDAHLVADLVEAAELVAAGTRAGDVVLFMGAGDIPRASRDSLRRIAATATEALTDAARAAGLTLLDEPHAPLSRYTSLRVGGAADLVARVHTVDDLVAWVELARAHGLPLRVLGRGTNVLVADEGLRGVVLINRCEAWQVSAAEEEGEAVLQAEGGVTLAALAQALARQGWAGLEAAVGIPGSLGGSVVTNAGAHGWDMAGSLLRAEVLTPEGDRVWWPADAFAFGYRHSRIKGDPGHIVLRMELRLHREAPEAILSRIAEYTARRRQSQPATPSVGSMFRNPEGDYAGRLIEACGLKGLRSGGAEISTKHANFFVNRDAARAADVLDLIDTARSAVKRRFGVQLELEIEALNSGSEEDGA